MFFKIFILALPPWMRACNFEFASSEDAFNISIEKKMNMKKKTRIYSRRVGSKFRCDFVLFLWIIVYILPPIPSSRRRCALIPILYRYHFLHPICSLFCPLLTFESPLARSAFARHAATFASSASIASLIWYISSVIYSELFEIAAFRIGNYEKKGSNLIFSWPKHHFVNMESMVLAP